MTYPKTPGFVRSSDTSRAAANSLLKNQFWSKRRRRIYNYVKAQQLDGRWPGWGAIVDEVQEALGLSHQAASGTCSAMVKDGLLHYAKEFVRYTRSGYPAHVLRIGERVRIRIKKSGTQKPTWNANYRRILRYLKNNDERGATADKVEVDLELSHQVASTCCGQDDFGQRDL